MRRPSDRLSTSIAFMFVFVVAISLAEALALGIAELVFDPTGSQRIAIGLPVFILAGFAGFLVLQRMERQPSQAE